MVDVNVLETPLAKKARIGNSTESLVRNYDGLETLPQFC